MASHARNFVFLFDEEKVFAFVVGNDGFIRVWDLPNEIIVSVS